MADTSQAEARTEPRKLVEVPRGATCSHRRMKDHCPGGCGHLECPDCGFFWDQIWEM